MEINSKRYSSNSNSIYPHDITLNTWILYKDSIESNLYRWRLLSDESVTIVTDRFRFVIRKDDDIEKFGVILYETKEKAIKEITNKNKRDLISNHIHGISNSDSDDYELIDRMANIICARPSNILSSIEYPINTATIKINIKISSTFPDIKSGSKIYVSKNPIENTKKYLCCNISKSRSFVLYKHEFKL